MFVCGGCGQHGQDEEVRYTAILESRLKHPSAHMFYLRFHSRACLDMLLKRLERHAQPYVVTDLTGREPKSFGPASPKELREMLGPAASTPQSPTRV